MDARQEELNAEIEHAPPLWPLWFVVSDKAADRAKTWTAQHEVEAHGGKPPYAGAIGGAYQWKFTPTGLGVLIVYRCMCGGEINLTDFSEW